MSNKVNLDNLKNEIATRKTKKEQVLVENGSAPLGKNAFLHELKKSLETGTLNDATKHVKGVAVVSENKQVDAGGVVSNKKNINTQELLSNHQIAKPKQGNNSVNENIDFNSLKNDAANQERSPKLYDEVANRVKQYQEQGINLNNYANMNENKQQIPQQPLVLDENTKQFFLSLIDEYMKENFVGIVQEIMKNSIIDMYSTKKIEETVTKNEDMIKDLFYKFLKDLKNKQGNKK